MGRGRKPARDRGRHFRSEKDVSDEEEQGGSGDDRWGPRKMVLHQRPPPLPPTDSDSDEEDSDSGDEGPSQKQKEEIKIREVPMKQVRDPHPPSESESEEDSSSEDDLMNNEYLRGPSRQQQIKKAEKAEVQMSAKEMKVDMARLEAIRKKREEDRLARIKAEGWDRYAPLSETNKPPGHGPVAKKD